MAEKESAIHIASDTSRIKDSSKENEKDQEEIIQKDELDIELEALGDQQHPTVVVVLGMAGR